MKKLAAIGLVWVVLMISIYTSPLWTRYPGGFWIPFIYLLIGMGFLGLLVKLIREVIHLIRNRNTFKPNHTLPAILIAVTLCFSFFQPFSFDLEEMVYGKVIFRACYEGTQNQARFRLREGNRFEIHSTGVFFSDTYFTGHYVPHGDTLELNYDEQVAGGVGTWVFLNNRDSIVEVLGQHLDTTRRPLTFYYGYCKGLN